MVHRYIAGNTILQALTRGKEIIKKGKTPVINYAIESTNSKRKVFKEYRNLSKYIDSNFRVALKLSSFDFDYNLTSEVIDLFKKKNVKILVDAESNQLNDRYQTDVNDLLLEHNQDSVNILKTYQMYRKDSLQILKSDIDLSYKNNYHLGIKLVRGAYWNSEKNQGHLYLKKIDTDLNYDAGVYEIFQNNNKNILAILATHNTCSINFGTILNSYSYTFEFAHLMGMKENRYNDFDYNVNVYVPYGPYNEMIPYLARRLYENKDTIKYMFQ